MSAASGGKSESEMLTSKQSRASVQRHAPSGDNFEVGTSLRKIDLSAQTARRSVLSAVQSGTSAILCTTFRDDTEAVRAAVHRLD